MQWSRRVSVCAGVVATIVLGAGAEAQATVPPQDVGWLYTVGGGGKVYFDADLAGFPSEEKITVCDEKTDGRGVAAGLWGTTPGSTTETTFLYPPIKDPSNNNECVSYHANYFADGFKVGIHIWEYWGDNTANDVWAYGVA